jgi:phosphoribosylanthranilate isomerase
MAELWIKICGMCGAADVEAAVAAGADAVGFVFHEPSPRNLTLDAARSMQRAVPVGVERVAVFLHPPQALVDTVIDALRPDWLQIDLRDLEQLALPAGQRVLPVLRSADESSRTIACNGDAAFSVRSRLMLDAGTSGVGMLADWGAAGALAGRCELVLAGGLTPGNVAEAVAAVRPFGLDVSSGVERARGLKDPARIREFIAAARGAAGVLTRGAGR